MLTTTNLKTAAAIAASALVALAVASVRFNRNDPSVVSNVSQGGSTLADAADYMAVVGYFRGDLAHTALTEPWAYRPVAPFMASLLPAEPLTALNLVNMAALVVSIACVALTVRHMGLSGRYQLLAGMMFAFSFPTFWYGAIGYVDPVAVAFISVAVLLIQLRLVWWLIPLAFVGVMAKESFVIVLPALAIAAHQSRGRVFIIGGSVAASLAGLLLVRALMPVPDGMGQFPWHFNAHLIEFNASRIRFWAAAGLTLAPLTVIAWGWTQGAIHRSDLWRLTGIATGLALLGYAVVSVYADGRPAWMMYPFLIPLTTLVIRRILEPVGVQPGVQRQKIAPGGSSGRSLS